MEFQMAREARAALDEAAADPDHASAIAQRRAQERVAISEAMAELMAVETVAVEVTSRPSSAPRPPSTQPSFAAEGMVVSSGELAHREGREGRTSPPSPLPPSLLWDTSSGPVGHSSYGEHPAPARMQDSLVWRMHMHRYRHAYAPIPMCTYMHRYAR